MTTTYHVCYSSMLGWKSKHAIRAAWSDETPSGQIRVYRTLKTAWNRDVAIQKECRRKHGENTYMPTRILASEDKGETFRELSSQEQDQLRKIACKPGDVHDATPKPDCNLPASVTPAPASVTPENSEELAP